MRLKSKDIAKMLNISPSAVSLALNNKPGVSAETRNRVNALIEEYYASGKFIENRENPVSIKGSIALVIHRTTKKLLIMPSRWFESAIDKVQAIAIENEYKLDISYYNPNMNQDVFLDSLNDERIAGVVVFATEMSREELNIYTGLQKPLVIMDTRIPVEGVDTVTINNKNGVAGAVGYAYAKGHRKIGFIKSRISINNFEDRFAGYIEGLRNVGLELNEDYIVEVGSTAEAAFNDFTAILESGTANLPTLYLSSFDYLAVGVMRALKTKGFKVPDDVSFIGFDDIELCTELDPPLTTLRILPDIGPIAIERLLNKINGKDGYYLNIEVGTELVERESVKNIMP